MFSYGLICLYASCALMFYKVVAISVTTAIHKVRKSIIFFRTMAEYKQNGVQIIQDSECTLPCLIVIWVVGYLHILFTYFGLL